MTDVKGYTPLSDAQKELANEGKELEERYLRWLDKLAETHFPDVANPDIRMIALACTNIQQATMWAVRAIFQPTRIKLPEDTP